MSLKSASRIYGNVLWVLILAAALTGMLTGPALAGDSEIVSEKLSQRTVELPGSEGAVAVEVRYLTLELKLADGETAWSSVISLYVPETGLFWWKHRYAGAPDRGDKIELFLKRHILYVSDREIVTFRPSKSSLWVTTFTDRFADAAEAERHLRSRIAALVASYKSDPAEGRHSVLLQQLPDEFVYRYNNPGGALAMSIVAAERHEATWEVTLESYRFRRAVLRLNSDFELIDVEVAADRHFDATRNVDRWAVLDQFTLWALVRLGRANGFLVCSEDLKEDPAPSQKRLSMKFHDMSIEQIVEAILEESGIYHWRFNGDVLNLISKELPPESNPFEMAVEGFQFTGTPRDFKAKVIQLASDIGIPRLQVYRADYRGREVEIEIGPGPLRHVFNAFARSSGMRWFAKVSAGPISPNDPTSRDPGNVGSVSVMFDPMQPAE